MAWLLGEISGVKRLISKFVRLGHGPAKVCVILSVHFSGAKGEALKTLWKWFFICGAREATTVKQDLSMDPCVRVQRADLQISRLKPV